jgi:dTDP-4-amino-4,6-dideoxygalactose transaminase
MDFVAAGFNYRMTDFQAALVNSQLQRLNDTLIYKNDLANTYFEHLDGAKMNLPETPDHCTHTWQTFHVLLDPKIDRDAIIDQLKNKGIGTNYGAQCIPAQTFYHQKYGFDSQRQFPNAYYAYTSGIAIPLYEKLSKEDISYIAKELNKLV